MTGEMIRRPIKRIDRTFSFLDLCNFTAFTDQEGDVAAFDVVTAFRAVVRIESTALVLQRGAFVHQAWRTRFRL